MIEPVHLSRKPDTVTEAFFGLGTPDAYSDTIKMASRIASRGYQQDAPHSSASTHELTQMVNSIDLSTPLGNLEDALNETAAIYSDHAVWFHHQNYLAHLNCPVIMPSLAAEVLVSSINSSVDTWDQSRSATLIEQKVIREAGHWVGYGHQADGVFTSGGSQSNLQALLLARGHCVQQQGGQVGLTNVTPEQCAQMHIYVSEHTHFSAKKSAAILGIPAANIIEVAADDNGRMCPCALTHALAYSLAQDCVPMAIVATAGSTDRGIIDPLAQIASIASQHNVWMHVDAAVGGVLAADETQRHRVAGIKHADSVTMDFHKTFFQPVSCSAILVKNADSLQHVAMYANYLNPQNCHRPNQVSKSLQTTRRFDALKLWLTLRTVGINTITAMFRTCEENAHIAHKILEQHPSFEVLEEPHLTTVLFRFAPRTLAPNMCSDVNRALREHLLDSGTTCIAATIVNDTYWLKFTLLNPETTDKDLRSAVEVINDVGSKLIIQSAGAYPSNTGRR